MRRTIASLVLGAGLLLVAIGGPAVADMARKPLLMSGKHSLYQRALVRPGAGLRQRPDTAQAVAEMVPFTMLYLYARREVDGVSWVEVGSDSHGKVQGWLPEQDLIPWKQALTVAFRDPVGHDRVLLFNDRDAVKGLADSHDIQTYERLYHEAESGVLPADSPVVGIQPAGYIDPREDFYLVPIQRHEDVYLGDEQALMLQVTSVPLGEAPRHAAPPPAEYRSGLVFVIDSTVSMGPYIDRTREAVRKVYGAIQGAGLTDKVSFGLVAYRDNTQAAPGLEYLARTYATLEDGRDPKRFFARVDALKPAKVSSRDFIEDAYAGIKQALDDINWNGHAARTVVLITDAGARPGADPLAHTRLGAEALRQLARDKGVALWVLHLLTPIGVDNHASAAEQYRYLSDYPGIGSFYYGVKTGDVQEFGRVLDALATQITAQVREVSEGTSPMTVARAPREAPPAVDSGLAELQAKVDKLGYALRMKYLRRREGQALPSVFNAWLLDRDFRDPRRSTLDVRVLLTRDQLSDLQYVLRRVLETAEEGLLSPGGFLQDLQSLAATISRDPGEVGRSTRTTGSGGNLADLGYMREYMEDLPYTGEVMSLSLESWADWPARRQFEFINGLESKISYYQALHDHTDLWVSLDGGPVSGDSVFPIALEMLP